MHDTAFRKRKVCDAHAAPPIVIQFHGGHRPSAIEHLRASLAVLLHTHAPARPGRTREQGAAAAPRA